MGRMSFVSYFSYVNTTGKITARSIMEVCVVLLEFADQQEKKNEQFEANFKEIENILKKLVDKKVPQGTGSNPNVSDLEPKKPFGPMVDNKPDLKVKPATPKTTPPVV